MVEWAEVHGHAYGTSRREMERKSTRKSLLLDIDIQGARQVREKFKKAVFIFVLPPMFQVLRERLESRGQDRPEEIAARLRNAKWEIRAYPEFDFVIVNDRLEQAVLELKSILISHRCRLETRQKEIVPILRSFGGES
jgi:guanylate kinase